MPTIFQIFDPFIWLTLQDVPEKVHHFCHSGYLSFFGIIENWFWLDYYCLSETKVPWNLNVISVQYKLKQ